MTYIDQLFGNLPLLLLVCILIAAYSWLRHINGYWRRNKIPHIQSQSIFGNMKDILFARHSAASQFEEFYTHPVTVDKPFFGIHLFHKPALVLRDPEIIKQVLVKDFSYFSDRYSASDLHSDTLGGASLFFLKNPDWRRIRAKITPFFTSGKMKQMFYLMNDIGSELNEMLMKQSLAERTKSVCMEMKDLCARYTTDTLASCAFGVRAQSLADPDSEFRRHGRAVFDFNWLRSLEFTSFFFLPAVIPYLGFKVFSKASSKFLRESISYVMDEREANGSVRNDLIDTLVTLRREDKDKKAGASREVLFQGDVLVAQAATFFTAGFETSSSLMSFGMYELSWKPELQARLREEIGTTLKNCNGQLTYDVVLNMEYLGMVIAEILRMYPPLPFLDRECTAPAGEKGYSLGPHSDFVIPRGMPVILPIYSIQRDEKYFDNPNNFEPDRFSPENRHKIVPYTYMPFGLGPRNCIGERFGQLQARLGIINFFRNHRVEPSAKTPRHLQLEPKALLIQSIGGIHLNVIRDPIC